MSQKLLTQGEDPNFTRLGFFAKTNIKANEELGYLRDRNAYSRSNYSDVTCECCAASRGGDCRGQIRETRETAAGELVTESVTA